jgi:hypothetical protein
MPEVKLPNEPQARNCQTGMNEAPGRQEARSRKKMPNPKSVISTEAAKPRSGEICFSTSTSPLQEPKPPPQLPAKTQTI